MILDVLVLGLAVFGLTEVIKLFLPFSLLSQVKGVIVIVFSAVFPVLVAESVREGVILGSAVLGMSLLFHALAKALDGVGETNRIQAMLQIAKRLQM